MTTRSKISVTLLLLAAIAGLGAVDAYINERELTVYLPGDAQTGAQKDGTGVPVSQGSAVEATIKALGFTVSDTRSPSLLQQVVGNRAAVFDVSLLQENDRTGSVTWARSPLSKKIFFDLKEALLPSFSPKVRNLHDRTEATPGRPVRNILSFDDEGLGPEHFLFVRSGDLILEAHAVRGKEEEMQRIIDALTVR